MNETLALLQSHRSIRKFTEEAVPQEQLEHWIQAGQAAATSSFIQACTVIQVDQGDQRNVLAHLAADQQYVSEAPVFLVFCADMRRHQEACALHEADMHKGYTEQFLTASLDVGLFAQNVVVAAESEGYGICYIGALRNNIEAVSKLLELPDLVYPVFGLCIGKPAQNPEVKPRLPLSVVLKKNTYTQTGDVEAMARYDAQVQSYYQQRTGNNKAATWTSQIANMLQKEARPHMLRFLRSKGFLEK
ncbi:oxygen-insensitive NADPH nitroreductase [Reinekea marina]|uniref:Oxygen-insensitive NADPH nitroreductase n=1 Tax=Reinekea marina TaxID=1310421 RepID=A0ABV7WP17_9GAMM|nr:oxygen-insensitive NADPH nitroreductase [Reinekea marina]MDN3650718.1 oxygen-insensitive NADPH nitroreductase [Reinekea marina]